MDTRKGATGETRRRVPVAWRALFRREYLISIRTIGQIGGVVAISLGLAFVRIFAKIPGDSSPADLRATAVISILFALLGTVVFNLCSRIYVDTDTPFGLLWKRTGQPLSIVMLAKLSAEALVTSIVLVPVVVLLVARHALPPVEPTVALMLLGGLAATLATTAVIAAALGRKNQRVVLYVQLLPIIVLASFVGTAFDHNLVASTLSIVYPPLAILEGLSDWATGEGLPVLLIVLLWVQAAALGVLSVRAFDWRIRRSVFATESG